MYTRRIIVIVRGSEGIISVVGIVRNCGDRLFVWNDEFSRCVIAVGWEHRMRDNWKNNRDCHNSVPALEIVCLVFLNSYFELEKRLLFNVSYCMRHSKPARTCLTRICRLERNSVYLVIGRENRQIL